MSFCATIKTEINLQMCFLRLHQIIFIITTINSEKNLISISQLETIINNPDLLMDEEASHRLFGVFVLTTCLALAWLEQGVIVNLKQNF